MSKINLILLANLFLSFACSNSTKNRQEQENKDSIQTVVVLENHERDTFTNNDDSYYDDDATTSNDDATLSNDDWEEDTLTGYIKPKEIDTANFAFNLKPKGNYNKIKAEIVKERLRLNKLYLSKDDTIWQKQILDSARNYVTNTLLNKIIPHWYGMPWDFAGYSAIPQKGTVGCSYFTSNTLLHAGFNVNRYKLAQQEPYNEAKSLDQNYKTYETDEDFSYEKINIALLKQIVKENKPGLYFVGLTNHVGYLLINEGELFFIHSNYGTLQVGLEYAKTSEEFIEARYYLAKITHNDDLIRKWLLNEDIKVFRD